MEKMYNATMQNGTIVSNVSNNESIGMSNPVKRNKMVPPPLNGALASKELADATRALFFAQLNVQKFKSPPVYPSF